MRVERIPVVVGDDDLDHADLWKLSCVHDGRKFATAGCVYPPDSDSHETLNELVERLRVVGCDCPLPASLEALLNGTPD